MTSDQRRCIQRSRFVCGILVFVCNEIKRTDLRAKFFYPLNSGDFVGAV